MSKVIAIANQKGGVGKTAVTASLAAGLTKQGYRVLAIDADPQGNLTESLQDKSADEIEITLADLMQEVMQGKEDISFKDCIIETKESIHLIPSNLELADVDTTLITIQLGAEAQLKMLVEKVRNDYDYILIDCLPSLGMLVINSLVACDAVIVPVRPDTLSVAGFQQLLKTIGKVKRSGANREIEILGVVFTMYQKGNKAHPVAVDTIASSCSDVSINVFDTVIPHSIEAQKATSSSVSLLSYNSSHPVSKAYEKLVKEVCENG